MHWTLPGTTLEALRSEADRTEALFQPMFLAGGMVLSQVASITGLEPYTIQNWVKRKFLPPPVNKRYDMEQLCRLININLLKGALPLERICTLMQYINGNLDDESDDLIGDTKLYFMFVRLAVLARHMNDSAQWDAAIETVMADYQEPIPGAKDRIVKVLRSMITAWIASRLRQSAEEMLQTLN